MEKVLNEVVPGRQIRVINLGAVASDSSSTLKYLRDNIRMYSPNIIVTMIGINDGEAGVIYGDYESSGEHTLRTLRFIRIVLSNIKERLEHARSSDSQTRDEDTLVNSEKKPSIKSYAEELIDKYKVLNFREKLLKKTEKLSDSINDKYEILIELGNFFKERYLYQNALFFYSKASELFPDDIIMIKKRAFLLSFFLNRWREAIVLFEKVYERGERDASFLLDMSTTYIQAGKFARAEEMVNKAESLQPNHMWLPFRKSEIYKAAGQYESA